MAEHRDSARRLNSVTVHLSRALRRTRVGAELVAELRSALSVVVFEGPLRMSDLAMHEQLGAAAITRSVDILARRGLVRRLRDPSDGRARLIAATAKGKSMVLQGRDERAQRIREALKRLPASSARRIAGALDDLEALSAILADEEHT